MSGALIILMAAAEQQYQEEKKQRVLEEKRKNMKKYLINIKQFGEGCDYTIACGEKTLLIEAENIKQAEQRFISMMKRFDRDDVDWTSDYGGYYDEQALEEATIYEIVDSKEIDVSKVYKDIEVEEILEKRKLIEAKEKAEYLRLKEKFE